MGNDSNQTPQNTETYLTFVLSARVTHLWVAPYSQYQQFLFDTITGFREKGWNYQQIADWFNSNDYRTPRGKMFHGSHAHSIVKKKRVREVRLTRRYPRNWLILSSDLWIEPLSINNRHTYHPRHSVLNYLDETQPRIVGAYGPPLPCTRTGGDDGRPDETGRSFLQGVQPGEKVDTSIDKATGTQCGPLHGDGYREDTGNYQKR